MLCTVVIDGDCSLRVDSPTSDAARLHVHRADKAYDERVRIGGVLALRSGVLKFDVKKIMKR